MDTLKLNKKEKGCFKGCLVLFFSLLALMFAGSLLPTGTPQWPESKTMVQSRTIGLALWRYSQDHAGKFPEGKSSTEIFQKLLDEKYIYDPVIFYYPLVGKIKPETSTLKPENVGWDVTCCADTQSPGNLPLVFLTGYKIVYQPGTKAVPLKKSMIQTRSNWWHETQVPIHFTAVFYAGTNAMALGNPDANGSFPNFISSDFDPKGKTYHQLTPDGELPP